MFACLVASLIVLVMLALVPPPVSIQTEEQWRDAIAGEHFDRTVTRVRRECADRILDFHVFAQEFLGVDASARGPVTWDQAAAQVLMAETDVSRFLDIDPQGIRKVRESIAEGKPMCVKEPCADHLTPVVFDRIVATCGLAVGQTHNFDRAIVWDHAQLDQRKPFIVILGGAILVLSCFSVFYGVTVGRLVSWIRHGSKI